MKLKKKTKLILSSVYIVAIIILTVSAFTLYVKDDKETLFDNVIKENDNAYIDVASFSKPFLMDKDKKTEYHFVSEKNNTGDYYVFIVKINTSERNKYNKVTDKKTVILSGRSKKITSKIKDEALSNVEFFLPADVEKITKDNFSDYFREYYLDGTVKLENDFSVLVMILLILDFLLIMLLGFTCFYKEV